MEKKMFQTNPHKSANKVTINSFMMGALFFILTLILTLSPDNFPHLVTNQIVLAIPLLYVSSLAYAKISYSTETAEWDALGWYTSNLGNLFVFNAIGLLAARFSQSLALTYFSLFLALMTIYTAINIKLSPKTWFERAYKLLFLIIVMIVGGLMYVV